MLELLSNAEMAEADRLTIAGGTSGLELMQQAGAAVANAVTASCPPGAHVAVVVGTGNNGGDGFVAARILRERNYRLRVLLVGDVARLKGDAAQASSSGAVGANRPHPKASSMRRSLSTRCLALVSTVQSKVTPAP